MNLREYLAGQQRLVDAELDRLAGWGLNALWLIGIWKRSAASRRPPSRILILMPHCVQNDACDFRITTDVGNCRRCGSGAPPPPPTLASEPGTPPTRRGVSGQIVTVPLISLGPVRMKPWSGLVNAPAGPVSLKTRLPEP